MAKRLSKEQKRDIFIENVINKMFEIAGYDVTYNDIKDRKDNWYTQWTMTMEQNEEWQKWGVAEIKKQFKYNTLIAEREMGMISLMWGLKFSDYSNNI
jgi:alpha-galactosidase/6-phospho-beta-glucosidase family protein